MMGVDGYVVNCNGDQFRFSLLPGGGKLDGMPFAPKKFTFTKGRSDGANVMMAFGQATLADPNGTVEITALDKRHIAGTVELSGKVVPGNKQIKVTGSFDLDLPGPVGLRVRVSARRRYPQARRIASAIPPPAPAALVEHVGRLGAHRIGRGAHRERAARDLEHRDVVDPVADGDRLGGGAADPPAQLGERGALRRPGRAHEHGVLAGVRADREADREQLVRVRAQHGGGGGDRVGLADRDGGERRGLPRARLLDDAQVGRPRLDVARVRRARVIVVDALGVEHEAREAVRAERRPQQARELVGHRVVVQRGVRRQLDEVAALAARDRALDRARARRAERAGLQPPGDDRDRHPRRLELGDRRDVVVVDALIAAQERAVEIEREQAVRHGPPVIPGPRPGGDGRARAPSGARYRRASRSASGHRIVRGSPPGHAAASCAWSASIGPVPSRSTSRTVADQVPM